MMLIVWLVLLALVSLLPIAAPKGVEHQDKFGHAIAYGVTAVLFFRQFRAKGGHLFVWSAAVVVAVLYGALLEVMQSFTPSREFSFADMAANAFGAVAAALIFGWRRR